MDRFSTGAIRGPHTASPSGAVDEQSGEVRGRSPTDSSWSVRESFLAGDERTVAVAIDRSITLANGSKRTGFGVGAAVDAQHRALPSVKIAHVCAPPAASSDGGNTRPGAMSPLTT